MRMWYRISIAEIRHARIKKIKFCVKQQLIRTSKWNLLPEAPILYLRWYKSIRKICLKSTFKSTTTHIIFVFFSLTNDKRLETIIKIGLSIFLSERKSKKKFHQVANIFVFPYFWNSKSIKCNPMHVINETCQWNHGE